MSTKADPLEAPWHAGWRSARANLVPGVALQIFALTLVAAYYHHPPTRALFERLMALRAETGFAFAIVSTGIAGGLLPFLYLRAQPATRARYTWTQGAALIGLWAYKGFETDLFYRLLAHLVGDGHEIATIALKAGLDQFVYSPLFTVPITVLAFEWIEVHLDRRALAADIRLGGWYRRRVLPVLVSNVGVWLPAVCIIYSLPTSLQLPLQNLVLCFYTLLVAHQTRRTG